MNTSSSAEYHFSSTNSSARYIFPHHGYPAKSPPPCYPGRLCTHTEGDLEDPGDEVLCSVVGGVWGLGGVGRGQLPCVGAL